MWKVAVLLLGMACAAGAEIRPMSLRQAVETAVKQNPDIMLARLEEENARQAVRVARDPFTPRVILGSGLAYSDGFPMSIEGSAPSIVQAHATQFLFNRQQSYAVAQSKEGVRTATLGVAGKREEVAYRTAALYLDAERAARIGEFSRKDADSLARVLESVQAQVHEGRALPLAEKQAALNVARARQVAESLESEQANTETALALALGFSSEDRVRPIGEQRPAPALPQSEEQAIRAALESSIELRRLQSQITAKGLEVRGERAARWPRVDLVAQYGMLAKFNNYDEFFRKFQRNNVQFGMSFQMPFLFGPGVSAQMSQTQTEISHLKIELTNARNRISSDLQQSFRDVKKTETAAEVARLDLDVAREQLSVSLAQMQEGRVTLRQVEEARIAENDKWIAFYDSQYAVEKAKWNILRLTGELQASMTLLPGPAEP